MIDSVNKPAVTITTTITESDFGNEYLFRTCSVTNNLVTSLESNLIHCATMLCHFRQTRSSYAAIPFILRGITATSSATGDYVAIPEHSGQNEEPAGRNEERTRNKSSLVPSCGFNRCSM